MLVAVCCIATRERCVLEYHSWSNQNVMAAQPGSILGQLWSNYLEITGKNAEIFRKGKAEERALSYAIT